MLTLARAVLYFFYAATCFIVFLVISLCSWHGLFPSVLGYSATLDTLRRSLWPLPLGSFIDGVFVPIFASVGTMTTEDIRRAPLPALLEYVHATIGTRHYSLGDSFSAGSVADRLARPVREQGKGYLKLGAKVNSLMWKDGQVEAVFQDGVVVEVDKVVVATQATSAKVLLSMLKSSLDESEQRRVAQMEKGLDEVEYRVSIAFVRSC